MFWRLTLFLSVFFILGFSQAVVADETDPEYSVYDIEAGTPYGLSELFRIGDLEKRFRLNFTHLNPWYLRGDFDGDGKPDYFVQVKSLTDGPSELVVLFGNRKIHWFSRQKLNHPGGAWYVYHKQKVAPSGWEEKPPPKLKGDAVMMLKPDSSAALVYWTGKLFDSYFVSD